MHFTKVELRENHSGIPLRNLDDVGKVLDAIEQVVGRRPKANANDVIATLQSGRGWNAWFNHIQYYELMAAYIWSYEGCDTYTVGFTQAPGEFEPELARLLGQELGTNSIYLIAELPVVSGRQFTLDVDRVFRIVTHFGFTNPKIPDSNALALRFARSAPHNLAHFFTNTQLGIRVNIDDSSLGPLMAKGRKQRNSGYGTLLGSVGPRGRCCLKFSFKDATSSPAYGAVQKNLRAYAQWIKAALEQTS